MRVVLFLMLHFSGITLANAIGLSDAYLTPRADFQFSTGNSAYYRSPVYFGGNFAFFPRQEGLFASISPIIGARVAPRLHLGLSAGIQYQQERIIFYQPYPDSTTYNYKSSLYDVSLFLRYFIHYRVFVHLEPELINVKNAALSWDYARGVVKEDAKRQNIFAGLVGLGFAAPIGQQSVFVLTMLYDIKQDALSPYGQYPFLRGGFNLGF